MLNVPVDVIGPPVNPEPVLTCVTVPPPPLPVAFIVRLFPLGVIVTLLPATRLTLSFNPFKPVSYTHLDVYKRQTGVLQLLLHLLILPDN